MTRKRGSWKVDKVQFMQGLVNIVKAYRAARNHAEFYRGKEREILFLEKTFWLKFIEHMEVGPNRKQGDHWKLPSGIKQRNDGLRQEMMI